ncbi:hypothetical protein FQN49_001141 [Arthroderma sp. PD_2]|nr:hypothetical protein FQN49_001141 [Arthroderma sp. PD_2]
MHGTINNTTTTHTELQGWVSSPNGRGTLDIVSSCVVTIILCGWSSICVNVPSPKHPQRNLLIDKWHMFCLCLLGPEFIYMLALGQYTAARESVQTFHNSGYPGWTLTHAFYANMGGFVFQPYGWKLFPINSKELHYLVTRGYLEFPKVTRREIKDRNKSSGLGRMITLSQILWFTLTVIVRAVQHLAITTLEVTTLGFIFCTLGTAVCWSQKPMDVESAIILESKFTMEEILINAGDVASEPYRLTPLDFVDRGEWIINVMWKYCVNTLGHMGIIYRQKRVRPIERISSLRFTKTGGIGSAVFSVAYLTIFFAAWNFHFPSQIEKLLWRVAIVITIGLCILGAGYQALCPNTGYNLKEKAEIKSQIRSIFSPGQRDRDLAPLPLPVTSNGISRQPSKESSKPPRKKTRNNFWDESRLRKFIRHKPLNNSPDKDPEFDAPFWTIMGMFPLFSLYIFCRLYILVEDFIGLRELPASAFQTVSWSTYLPHF